MSFVNFVVRSELLIVPATYNHRARAFAQAARIFNDSRKSCVTKSSDNLRSDLRELRTTMVQNVRSLRKFLGTSNPDIHLAKTPRAPSSE